MGGEVGGRAVLGAAPPGSCSGLGDVDESHGVFLWWVASGHRDVPTSGHVDKDVIGRGKEALRFTLLAEQSQAGPKAPALADQAALSHHAGVTDAEGAVEQSLFTFSEVMSEADRQAVLAAAEGHAPVEAGVYTPDGEGATRDVSLRDAALVPLDLPWLRERIWPLIRLANRAGGWNLPLQAATPWQFATYGPGGHHDWHEDTEPPAFADRQEGLERKITLSLRLSPMGAYDGGAFEIRTPESGSREAPLDALGDAVIFPSRLLHRVAPVTRGQRESLVMWVLGPRQG